MIVVNRVAELNAALANCPKEGVGFVPTMGALHRGHRSLVERARKDTKTDKYMLRSAICKNSMTQLIMKL